eukprot:COSAG01_NODE_437_length_17047_cov_194.928015_12_plen_111_part_00
MGTTSCIASMSRRRAAQVAEQLTKAELEADGMRARLLACRPTTAVYLQYCVERCPRTRSAAGDDQDDEEDGNFAATEGRPTEPAPKRRKVSAHRAQSGCASSHVTEYTYA